VAVAELVGGRGRKDVRMFLPLARTSTNAPMNYFPEEVAVKYAATNASETA
jgi:hypothetical protein